MGAPASPSTKHPLPLRRPSPVSACVAADGCGRWQSGSGSNGSKRDIVRRARRPWHLGVRTVAEEEEEAEAEEEEEAEEEAKSQKAAPHPLAALAAASPHSYYRSPRPGLSISHRRADPWCLGRMLAEALPTCRGNGGE